LDWKFYVDSKKGLSHIVRIYVQKFITAQSERYDVIGTYKKRRVCITESYTLMFNLPSYHIIYSGVNKKKATK